ncbi:hypothetical protein SS1G_07251 [Sclerotinia sclerotiorum 1980 UF-70]|uniref:SAP domain-containing protein n=2 Tax=Sclerotinia sclerotiorum (strain ATCC 18683 / 1980 / Ss-1) TaxID=665079 RepID=A7EPK2_SCLS1|nr:hypothetical protein SS1G_07251 [Sclerotinia sclerotiorum 1980 UF-70]APA10296.1 hypothetical protein sscle_06g050660 [Sclerotinia sclerotiorum 1980 UF-70]EDO04768.1 hypothetical protein SS1G_07251 [Sclerotinia sclerotiorum 1980 UF-70]
MTDYSQLKVPELKKLLQEKSLPISGNKADLIARLQESEKKPAAEATATTGEDEIDWDEDDEKKDEKKATTTAALVAAGAKEDIPNPTKVPNQEPAIDPAKTTDLKVKGGEGVPTAEDGAVAASGPTETEVAAAPEAPKQDFSAGIEKSDAQKEAEKRAARAKRFNIPESEEAAKLAERAKKFGVDNSKIVEGLDSALPERRPKRAREESRQGGRNAKRQTPDSRKPQSGPKHTQKSGPKQSAGGRVTDNPAEKAKAEARAKRFATAE